MSWMWAWPFRRKSPEKAALDLLRGYFHRDDVRILHVADRAAFEVRVGLRRYELPYPLPRSTREASAMMMRATRLEDIPTL